MPAIAFALLLLALILLWIAARQRRAAGIPGGRVIYSDTKGWHPVEKPLYHPVLGLTGRPDYLVEQGEAIIPVEVKSSQVTHAPYDGHIYQLAAYCLLVHHTYGVRPDYGILHYPNRTFAIDYTSELENGLLTIIGEIRRKDRAKDVNRSHEEIGRCLPCGYRNICDRSLK